jgi:hypothetical protein
MTEINRTTDNLTMADFAGRTPVADRPAGNEANIENWRPDPETEAELQSQNQVSRASAGYGDIADAASVRGPVSREVTSFPDHRADFRSEANPGISTPSLASVTPLFSESEITELRSRWNNIQAEFVDEPRRSVEQADQLVAAAMQQLAEGFAAERASLEQQWESGDNVSTEDLRVALQRYRAFFGRLLNVA